MANPITFEVYLRYVRQQSATRKEARAVQAWLADPINESLALEWLHQYAQLLEQEEGIAEGMPDFELIQDKLLRQLGLIPAQQKLPLTQKWSYWAAAAVLLIGLLTGSFWLWRTGLQAPALATLTTAEGERRTVQLPDGSRVKLNGHSTLRYAANLDKQGVREVWLDGEGFFAVQHLPDHRRFVVHTTAGFNVEVLGTQFTVYRRRAQARVVLLSGKVRVDFADQARSKEVILKPGELLETRDAQPRLIVHKAVKVAPYASWKDDRLVFDDTPLAEVATRLSDTYGVPVVVADPALAQRRITGSFPVGELDDMLLVLEKSFHLTVRRDQKQVILSSHPTSFSDEKNKY